jgi:hypothetical protein
MCDCLRSGFALGGGLLRAQSAPTQPATRTHLISTTKEKPVERKHQLLVLTAVLVALTATSSCYGAEHRKDIPINQQHIAQFVPQANISLRRHPRDFKRCDTFERKIEVVSGEELPVIDPLLYPAPSIEGMARQFRRVEVLTHRQRGCERLEKRRATRRLALTECVRQVSQTYGMDRPRAVPWSVKAVICAASYIDDTPYIWGGGHVSFDSSGYDCSGAVSYALHGGLFLESPLDSTGLSFWGAPGPGKWITVYANSEHTWMTIAGVTFDTVGGPGPRWHRSMVSSQVGFAVRHPAGY